MRWAIIIGIVVALSVATYRAATHRDHLHLDGWYVIELGCSGGKAPPEHIMISDGMVELGVPPHTTRMPANKEDLAKLRQILEAHEFSQLDGEYEGDPVKDGCATDLRIRTRSQSRRIRAFGRGHWPAALEDAVSAIRVLELPLQR
jgi:hypothetical protein